MQNYVTGNIIKKLREEKGITQQSLAEKLGVTDKAVSKWETSKGFPDISLIEPLSSALGVSVIELLNGEQIINKNISSNVLKTKFYVCPVCGNILTGVGDAVISCCGITLPSLEVNEPDEEHKLSVEQIEYDYFVSLDHTMSKKHYISFFALLSSDELKLKKLYPEGNAQARFPMRGGGYLYYYCNKHGLYMQKM